MKSPSKNHQKWLEELRKQKICSFENPVKYLHICCGILIVGKRDFRIFVIFARCVTISALKHSFFWNFPKRAEFYLQNHQYSLGNNNICSFFDFRSRRPGPFPGILVKKGPRARKPLNSLLSVRPHLHENIGKSSPKMIKKRQCRAGFESATMTIGGAQKGPINV